MLVYLINMKGLKTQKNIVHGPGLFDWVRRHGHALEPHLVLFWINMNTCYLRKVMYAGRKAIRRETIGRMCPAASVAGCPRVGGVRVQGRPWRILFTASIAEVLFRWAWLFFNDKNHIEGHIIWLWLCVSLTFAWGEFWTCGEESLVEWMPTYPSPNPDSHHLLASPAPSPGRCSCVRWKPIPDIIYICLFPSPDTTDPLSPQVDTNPYLQVLLPAVCPHIVPRMIFLYPNLNPA